LPPISRVNSLREEKEVLKPQDFDNNQHSPREQLDYSDALPKLEVSSAKIESHSPVLDKQGVVSSNDDTIISQENMST